MPLFDRKKRYKSSFRQLSLETCVFYGAAGLVGQCLTTLRLLIDRLWREYRSSCIKKVSDEGLCFKNISLRPLLLLLNFNFTNWCVRCAATDSHLGKFNILQCSRLTNYHVSCEINLIKNLFIPVGKWEVFNIYWFIF